MNFIMYITSDKASDNRSISSHSSLLSLMLYKGTQQHPFLDVLTQNTINFLPLNSPNTDAKLSMPAQN